MSPADVPPEQPHEPLRRSELEPKQVREMPGPRENPGMAAPYMQKAGAWPFRAVLAGLYKAGVRPMHLTIASVLLNVIAGALILRGEFLAGGLVLVPAGLADVFDGSIARLRGEESKAGAFLDSFLDRVSDIIIFGTLYLALISQGQELEAALALVTLVVSLGVSFVRAEAEANGLSLSEGLFQRTERYVATVAGLVIPGLLVWALGALAILGAVTFVQRLWTAGRRLARPN